MRIPADASINVQAAFRELEGEIRGLKQKLVELEKHPESPTSDVAEVKAELSRLIRKPNTLDFNDVFRGSGPAHALGYVPDPGPTEDNEAVLLENGSWGYPVRGLVRAATNNGAIGDEQLAGDIVAVNGGLAITGPLSAADTMVGSLLVSGSIRNKIHLISPGGSGTAGISPELVSGLQGWWAARFLTGLADGDPVSTLNDVSGNVRHFTGSSTARPLYKTNIVGGYPILRFDGSNDVMGTAAALSTFIANNAGTIFIVAKPTPVTTTATDNGDQLLSDTGGIIGLNVATGAERFGTQNYDGSQDYATITATISDAFHSFLWMHNGTNVFAGLDDARDASLTNTASGNTASLTGTLQLARSRSLYSIFTEVDIAEVIAYNEVLSETDRQGVEAYLANLYDLTLGYPVNAYSDDNLVLIEDVNGNEAFRISGLGKVYVRGTLVH